MSTPYFSICPLPGASAAATAWWLIENLGWLVLPAVGKRPTCEHREEVLPFFDIDRLARRWARAQQEFGPNLNVAVLTGKRSLVVVADVDPRSTGELRTLWDMGWPQDTVIVRTAGEQPGWHVYAECGPDGLPSIPNYAPGIELKANGALVIAPPSIHPDTGNVYAYLSGHAPWEVAVAPLPDAVVETIRAHTPVPQATRLAPEDMASMHEWRDIGLSREQVRMLALKRYRKALRKVREDGAGRNNTMFWLGRQLQSLGMPAADILAWVEAFGKLVKNG